MSAQAGGQRGTSESKEQKTQGADSEPVRGKRRLARGPLRFAPRLEAVPVHGPHVRDAPGLASERLQLDSMQFQEMFRPQCWG